MTQIKSVFIFFSVRPWVNNVGVGTLISSSVLLGDLKNNVTFLEPDIKKEKRISFNL